LIKCRHGIQVVVVRRSSSAERFVSCCWCSCRPMRSVIQKQHHQHLQMRNQQLKHRIYYFRVRQFAPLPLCCFLSLRLTVRLLPPDPDATGVSETGFYNHFVQLENVYMPSPSTGGAKTSLQALLQARVGFCFHAGFWRSGAFLNTQSTGD
jgi:hypothetical protein